MKTNKNKRKPLAKKLEKMTKIQSVDFMTCTGSVTIFTWNVIVRASEVHVLIPVDVFTGLPGDGWYRHIALTPVSHTGTPVACGSTVSQFLWFFVHVLSISITCGQSGGLSQHCRRGLMW